MLESPLVRFEADASVSSDAEVILGERPFLGHLNLRGRGDDPEFLRAAENALGTTLPVEPNTATGNGDGGVIWLGPDEWLVLTPENRETEVHDELVEALDKTFSSVVDVSSGNTIIALSGSRARELLAKGTSLDLHPRAFPVGRCAQTHFAHAGALICLWDERPAFELVVRRSFADYLWQWLLTAARDMAVGIQAPIGRLGKP